MEVGDTWQLIVLVALLALSSFFSASETALMSLSKIRIRNMVEENILGSKKVQKLVENPSTMLSAILVGNNVVNIGASSLATSLAIKNFGSAGVGLATGIMTLLVLIFSEITPKSLAAQNSEKIALKVAPFISVVVVILKPFNVILNYLTNRIIKVLGGEADARAPFITEAELKTMINVSHEEGMLESEEKVMIHNVFEFRESRVTEVMTPRTYMVAVNLDSPYEKIVEVFKTQQYSRIPVYDDGIDNVVGILYLKDLIFFDASKETFEITKYMREPYFTFEFKLITELFSEMRDKSIQVAIVIDEYGGTAGMITLEDLVEEIVGDIRDESDELFNEIEVVKEDDYLVRGSAEIDLVNEMLGVKIESEDFDTIGGFVTGLFGRLPEAGEQIEFNNMKFIVEHVQRYRIEKLRIFTY
ncbi:HlyC/CorC family transporter [Trichococcus collinsii]|uniref:Hemolysin n=1 Tax=Trichococcus collinsii TaxID=157076 RepID=A0AB38A047_9LACT|nr:hemolysin family protein [Trichococcus collinsii]SEA46323.1 putative hemolysin [Trichococcus collinsii]